MSWNDAAAQYLRTGRNCPRCDRGPVGAHSCPFCGAILTGSDAEDLRSVSAEAAELLERRGALIARLGTAIAFAPPPTGAPSADSVAPTSSPSAAPTQRPAAESSQVSLQSVLAIAGALLFAVAFVVFRFFSTDVDVEVRRIVIGIATVLFFGFSWLLARVRLTFSAEAVGALAIVFLGLDVQAFAEVAPDDVSAWTFAALGTLVASLLSLTLAVLIRLRTWLWLGLVGLTWVPAFFGYAVVGPFSATVGHLGSVAVALLGFEAVRRLSDRFDSPLRADRVTLVLVAGLFHLLTVVSLLTGPSGGPAERIPPTSLLLAVAAVLAGVATRTLAAGTWSALGGILLTVAAAILPLALELDEGTWYLTLLPVAAAIALVTLAHVPWPTTVRRTPLRAGSVAVTLAVGVPATLVAGVQLFTALNRSAESVVPAQTHLAALVGLAALTAGLAVLAVADRRGSGSWRPWLVVAAWFAGALLAAAPAWSGLLLWGQAIVGLVVAAGIAAAAIAVPRLRDAGPAYRAPLLLASHAILAYLVGISWRDDALTVPVGAAVVLVLAIVARALPASVRALYVAVGYGYALIVFARGLDLVGLETIPVIAFTATAASLVALGVTLVRRISAPLWYAVLAVTAVPFAIGVATVVAERTWETALANGAIFALALTLTLTRRPGLTRPVRAGAAALLLPSLAVVAVNLVPRIIETNVVPAWNGAGGAPVVLPIVATLVALVLPTTPLIAQSLRRGEVPGADVTAVTRWIEISAYVTGGIAAVLSLVLETPDLGTALVVFVVLGIGGAASSVFAHRRSGWWIAAGSWTAALWCVWGLVGITDVEPYVYPPALAAVVVGTALVRRGRPGVALVAPGLAIAIATSLIVLAANGSGPGATLPWRALALVTGSAALLVVGILIGRRGADSRAAPLRLPMLLAAIGAASAGAIQAIRFGLRIDPSGFANPDAVVLPVLGFSAVATLLAALAGRGTGVGERWALVPALVFLVVGPIFAVAPGVWPMWTLWGLALALLVVMVVSVQRELRGRTILPPTWLLFAAAWCVAVAGWSVRDLHVEWFSLPLGVALTLAGALVLWRGDHASDGNTPGGTIVSWPVGFTHSWTVLAPGIVVTLLPSILATGTNPATWRAILVIGLALITLLAGSLLRYAAPFVLSLIAFALEIAVVFLAQIGRDIDPLVLWIALATAGAVLLVIAVGFERRTGGDRSLGARMRDLR